ncbi:MAG: AAA-like domain-containing protein [Anaerolineae bacterium]|nr:AAA-like domain-containing protein [Anaerolineae bacterium]
MSVNPFTYGKPIDHPDRFIGRRREIEQVYSRLLAAFESSSIVGERRTGKTSLLKYLTHPDPQAKFGLDAAKYIFIYQDFQLLDENTTPSRFWKRVLAAIKRAISGHEGIVNEIDRALKDETVDNYTLDDIFTLIDEEELYIVLLLDEFENVTRNRHFDNDFFGGLRSLAIHHNLALITSSQKSLVELTHSEEVRTSPFFNIFATIHLRAFSEEEATELIDRYLASTGTKFLISELNVIFALASYHPHFLQVACHHLFAAYEKGLASSERGRYVTNQVREEAAPLFWDYWYDSTPAQKILLTVLALRELERESAENTIEDLEQYYSRVDQVMGDLERRALVSKNPQNSTYHLISTELREWIADEIFGGAEDRRGWRDWEKGESLIGVLPAELQQKLSHTVQSLNPDYREIMGNWLIDPATAEASLQLAGSCVSQYEQFRTTRPQRDAASQMVDTQEPVGDTPKGLFARLSRQLETGQPAAPVSSTLVDDTPSPSLPQQEAASSTGRLLKTKKKATVSPTALRGLIISGIVTNLGLEAEDQDFVNRELEWLFSATDNLLKICGGEIDRDQPVSIPIPADAEQTAGANNQLLTTIDDSTLVAWKSWLEVRLEWINAGLRDLDILLGQEASRGTAGKSDLELQNTIRNKRIEIVQMVEEKAQLINQAYGIRVTSPSQLVGLLEE